MAPRKYHILIVDDDEYIRLAIRDVLEDAGYEVCNAENGNIAYQLLLSTTNQPFSLVITDIKMPMMDGMELLQHVKLVLPNLPVIFVSAHHEQAFLEKAKQLGISGFVKKPFDNNNLLKLVDHVLHQKSHHY